MPVACLCLYAFCVDTKAALILAGFSTRPTASRDLRKAYRQLERLLREIASALETEDIPAARTDLEKAFEALNTAGSGEEGQESLQYMDHALSYAHRVIGDLLHEKGLPPHSPADFAAWYDAGEVPFREDW